MLVLKKVFIFHRQNIFDRHELSSENLDRHELSSENLWPTLFVSSCRITEILIFAFKRCNTVCAICGFVEIPRPIVTIDGSINFLKCRQ